MQIGAEIPCHGRRAMVTASGLLADPARVGDRKCPVCACWWRFDTRLLAVEVGRMTHAVEWTRVGQLSK